MATEEIHGVGPGIQELLNLCSLGVVIAIAYFAGWKGIKKSLLDRSSGVSKKLEDTRLALELVQRDLATAKKDLNDLSDQRIKMINEAKEEGRKIYDKLVDDSRKMGARMIADVKVAAENEALAARDRLQSALVETTMQQVAKTLDPARAKGVHERYLNEISLGGPAHGKK